MDPEFDRLAAAYVTAQVWAHGDHDTTDETDAAYEAVITAYDALWRHVLGMVEAGKREARDAGIKECLKVAESVEESTRSGSLPEESVGAWNVVVALRALLPAPGPTGANDGRTE